jgi:hypothetical protein
MATPVNWQQSSALLAHTARLGGTNAKLLLLNYSKLLRSKITLLSPPQMLGSSCFRLHHQITTTMSDGLPLANSKNTRCLLYTIEFSTKNVLNFSTKFTSLFAVITSQQIFVLVAIMTAALPIRGSSYKQVLQRMLLKNPTVKTSQYSRSRYTPTAASALLLSTFC